MDRLREWRSEHLNEPVRWLKKVGDTTGGPGIQVQQGHGTTLISLLKDGFGTRKVWGKIVEKGPKDEDDWHDERYWVKAQYFTNGLSDIATPAFSDENSWHGKQDEQGEYITIITATNVGEMPDGKHKLKVDDVVECWEIYPLNDGVPLWVFNRSPAPIYGTLFVVNLEMTSGTGGDATTVPSFEYTVTSLDDEELLINASPLRPRPIGLHEEAEQGYAFYNSSGDPVLAEAWELPAVTTECDDEMSGE